MCERKGWVPIEGETVLKVFAGRDSRSKSTFAHAVPVTGVDEKRYIADNIVDDCAWLGYSLIVVKPDNEAAINKAVLF